MNHLRSKAPGDMDLASGDGPGLEVYIGNCRLVSWGLPRWHSGEEPVRQCRRHKRRGFDPWVGKTPWSRKWQPIPYSIWKIPQTEEPGGPQSMGAAKRDMSEHTHTHTHRHVSGNRSHHGRE